MLKSIGLQLGFRTDPIFLLHTIYEIQTKTTRDNGYVISRVEYKYFLGAYEQTVKYVAGCKLSFRLFAGVSHRGILPLAISEC